MKAQLKFPYVSLPVAENNLAADGVTEQVNVAFIYFLISDWEARFLKACSGKFSTGLSLVANNDDVSFEHFCVIESWMSNSILGHANFHQWECVV